jgi:hypothetical protein
MQATCNNHCARLAQDRFVLGELGNDMGGNWGNRHLITELESGNRALSDGIKYRFSLSYFLPAFPCSGHTEESLYRYIAI